MPYILVVGSRNYSSWSLRPWLAMRASGIPLEDVLVLLDQPDTRENILRHSPAGKVPVLKTDRGETIWDSLAIIEEMATRHPEAKLWPEDSTARAHARSISAEMHSGFQALRGHLDMNLHRPVKPRPQKPEVEADIARIIAIWTDTRARFGHGGPFLFGSFTGADAMYAPVVWRFHTYAVPVPDDIRAYMDAVIGLPAMQQWYEAARDEPRAARYEID
ncbi:glutathione S-transferase [Agaricicola taiwanensis]|uniref:Glutathione S-transferase n=1 Tax=Agaricicola taiwanensis TaxID=591372 RepID=A0A8J2YIY5_9RHOB|nr:glutathione S-transferase family protein [Agaricicola taiwanensis]GGE46498.1 glutathione S-transferase [Agaricicola taiwanensis]